jgi:tRNA(Ile2) C34 agmatinyltransferase TiaS
MTRRLQTCARCGGKTRHADRRCSRCRRGRPVVVSLLLEVPRDLRAPTVAELKAARPIGHADFTFRNATIESFTWEPS